MSELSLSDSKQFISWQYYDHHGIVFSARLLVEKPFVECSCWLKNKAMSDTCLILFLTEVRHLVEKKMTKCQTLLFSKQVSIFFYLSSAITKKFDRLTRLFDKLSNLVTALANVYCYV